MVTLTFIPGPSKKQTLKAIRETIDIKPSEAREAIDIQRISCREEDKQKLIDAIEIVGGMVM